MPSRPRNQMERGQRGITRLNLQMGSVDAKYIAAEARVASLVARAIVGGTITTQRVRKALRSQVNAMMVELNTEALPDAKKIIANAYDLGRRLADAQSTGRVDDTALKLLEDNLTDRLTNASVLVGRRVDDIFRRAALDALARSQGGDAPASMERILRKQGIGSFQDSSGRIWALADYARMAVKTTAAEAQFTATHLTLQSADLDLIDINSVPNPCSRCIVIDGKTFSLSGKSDTYPLFVLPLPIHPECQHFATVSRHNFAPVPA